MQDRELYQQILGIVRPWRVRDVELDMTEGEVVVELEHEADAGFRCAECDRASPIHDHTAERRWCHLDTCQLKTVIRASVPRTNRIKLDSAAYFPPDSTYRPWMLGGNGRTWSWLTIQRKHPSGLQGGNPVCG